MARTDIAYTDSREPVHCAIAGCEFVGVLYKKRQGFDVYLSLTRSDLSALEISLITRLRQQADDHKDIFIESVSGFVRAVVFFRARRLIRDWLWRNLSLEYGPRDRIKELLWLLGDLLTPWWDRAT